MEDPTDLIWSHCSCRVLDVIFRYTLRSIALAKQLLSSSRRECKYGQRMATKLTNMWASQNYWPAMNILDSRTCFCTPYINLYHNVKTSWETSALENPERPKHSVSPCNEPGLAMCPALEKGEARLSTHFRLSMKGCAVQCRLQNNRPTDRTTSHHIAPLPSSSKLHYRVGQFLPSGRVLLLLAECAVVRQRVSLKGEGCWNLLNFIWLTLPILTSIPWDPHFVQPLISSAVAGMWQW